MSGQPRVHGAVGRALDEALENAKWRSAGSGLALVALAGLVGVVLGELDRLIASIPGADGRSHSLNVVLSPIGPTQLDSWNQWAGAPLHEQLGQWIIVSAVIDFLLMTALTLLFIRLIQVGDTRSQLVPTVVLVCYVLAEVIENGLQIAGGIAVIAEAADVALAIGRVMALATVLKVLSLIVFVVAVLRIPPYRSALAHWIAGIARAVWVHRLATLAIVVLAVLSCVPASDLLDQLPDVQRQWIDGVGWSHGLFAGAALLLTAVVTFVLGRRRTRLVVEVRVARWTRHPAKGPVEAALPWFLAPGVLLAAGGAAWLASHLTGTPLGIHPPTYLTMLIVTTLVPLLAMLGHPWVEAHPPDDLATFPRSESRARWTWIVGDALALLVIVAGGIGLVRSFLVPLVLGPGTDATAFWSALVAVVIGMGVAIGAPLLLPSMRRWNWRRMELNPDPASDPGDGSERVSPARAIEWWTLAGGAAFLVHALLFPTHVAGLLGGVAATLLALTAWVAVLGGFTLVVQPLALIAPFRWMRLKAAPVLTLAILLPFAINLVVSAVAPDKALHAVRVSDSSGTATIEESPNPLIARLERMQVDGCGTELEVDVRDGTGARTETVPVRPVFLIAAEGGGIRAAYWTASALAELDGCAASSGFVSSGISGGSLGLAIASTIEAESGTSTRDALLEAAKGTSGPDVVSTAVLGLAVGDAFAGGAGVRIPSYLDPAVDMDDPGWRWRDRAALVEAIWERSAPGLSGQFSDHTSAMTGVLMLSSTDVVSRCRLLVDQAPFPTPTEEPRSSESPGATASPTTPTAPDAEARNACDAVGGLPSMYGFRELPGDGGPDVLTQCLMSLDWSTATMLSARFAIVTPTGGLPADEPCDRAKGAQFVDGGYVEPTSLAAVADMAPRLMAMIAEQNETRGQGEPWLLPTLLYLRNTQGYDLVDDANRAESESLVPITGGAAKTHLMAEDAWIQRITQTMPAACPDSDDAQRCRDAMRSLFGILPGGVVVVAPDSKPGVVPPLGWALSEMSRKRFTAAIDAATACNVDGEPSRTGYAGLRSLDGLMDFLGCPSADR